MRILVFGASGFIGSRCVEYFRRAGHVVFGADLNPKAPSEPNYIHINSERLNIGEAVGAEDFDLVLNAAGSADVQASKEYPLRDFKANCSLTFEILEQMRNLARRARYVHISSAAVYGNPIKLPVLESDLPNPISPYGWNKLVSEMICQEFYSFYKMPIVIVRPFSVYGPGLKKQLFWDLYLKSRNSTAIQLFGTGNESRDYIHIDDFISAINSIISYASFQSEIFNLGTGKETTIRTAVELFFSHFDPKVKIEFEGQIRDGDPLNWKADIGKLQKLGYAPKIPFSKGIESLAKWYASF